MQRLEIYEKTPSKRKESEPNKWVSGEYSRLRYTWFTNVHDTYASSEFARRLVKYFPFKIKTIQTDNGFEFTNRLSWQAFLKDKKTMFENTLEELGLKYKVIKPHTPKQNGRVERSHRKYKSQEESLFAI